MPHARVGRGSRAREPRGSCQEAPTRHVLDVRERRLGRWWMFGSADSAREDGSVPSVLPEGEPAPPDGALPVTALTSVGNRGLGLYVHVPFCAVRCGYCDFNTYTIRELDGASSPAAYVDAALAEVRLARR